MKIALFNTFHNLNMLLAKVGFKLVEIMRKIMHLVYRCYQICQKAPPLAGGDEWRGVLGGRTP